LYQAAHALAELAGGDGSQLYSALTGERSKGDDHFVTMRALLQSHLVQEAPYLYLSWDEEKKRGSLNTVPLDQALACQLVDVVVNEITPGPKSE